MFPEGEARARWEERLLALYDAAEALLADPDLPPGARAAVRMARALLWSSLDGQGLRYHMHYTPDD
ncbi:MAG: DUF6052 family protein [Firmicutes bacterium]|nr:DUF6052 family protein [Bacillota bacterium]